MPDWDNTESRERDEDAAWRDLIARFGAPAMDGPTPWPERENMPSAPGAQGDIGTDGAVRPDLADQEHDGSETAGPTGSNRGDDRDGTAGTTENERGNDRDGTAGSDRGDDRSGTAGAERAERVWRALEAEGLLGQTEPDVIQVTRRLNRTPAEWVPVHGGPADEDEEHFVPPEPLPLPKLDPVTKGAWAALFGGPGYLMTATALHWSVPGYAAFLAVAAFVTGFALLVLRMNDPRSGGPNDGDDGAIV